MGARPEQGYSEKFAHLFQHVNIYDDVPNFWASIADVSRPLLLLYAAHFCLSEVYNGGFLQLFWNNTGVLTPEAIAGFLSLDMPGLAGVFVSAAGVLGSPYPRDRGSRWNALLAASSLSEVEIQEIFEGFENFYLAFETSTAMLPFGDLNARAFELAKSENGGFQRRATEYAREL